MTQDYDIDSARYVMEKLTDARKHVGDALEVLDYDTHTGHWNELSKALEILEDVWGKLRFLCIDCGKDTIDGEYYMVSDELWEASGLGGDDGMACLACLEKRIGRLLTFDDFTAVVHSKEVWQRHVGDRTTSHLTRRSPGQPRFGA